MSHSERTADHQVERAHRENEVAPSLDAQEEQADPAQGTPKFDVATAARWSGASVEGSGASSPVLRVVIDSRDVRPGDLFVALPGSRTHGNGHVADALSRGAVAALVDEDCPALPDELAREKSLLRVASPRRALGDLAAAYRRTLTCPVVAVTGSNGKSTTREMIARVLAPLGAVVQSKKSYNNDLGVPLTLLEAGADTAALVVEVGTSGPGEIARLAEIARPTAAVVTNVSAAHLQGLGDEEGVAHEKAELVRALPAAGFAILNADDPRVARMARDTQACVVTYSLGDWKSAVWGTEARRTARGIEFFLFGKGRMFLPIPGVHNVSNALAAATVGLLHGIDAEQMRAQFRHVRLPAMRLQKTTADGVTLFLDCYNANPASMRAATEELVARPVAGRRVLVMGDMLELGSRSAELHYGAGRHAASRVDLLWCVGPQMLQAYEAAIESGMDPTQVRWSESVETAIAEGLPPWELRRGDVVLLKASRGLQLERLAERLRARRGAGAPVAQPEPRMVG